MSPELTAIFANAPAACRLTPKETEGTYFRNIDLDRRAIAEDRPGLPLQLGVRVMEADDCTPAVGAVIEVWQADADGRYSGYPATEGGEEVAHVPQPVLLP